MAEVNEQYWHRYYQTHNEARFVDLVDEFFHVDGALENPNYEVRGRDALLDYFQGASEHAQLTLVPHAILVKPGVSATEDDFIVEPRIDLPDFVTGPLKAGERTKIRMAGFYHMDDDRITLARIYWGRTIS